MTIFHLVSRPTEADPGCMYLFTYEKELELWSGQQEWQHASLSGRNSMGRWAAISPEQQQSTHQLLSHILFSLSTCNDLLPWTEFSLEAAAAAPLSDKHIIIRRHWVFVCGLLVLLFREQLSFTFCYFIRSTFLLHSAISRRPCLVYPMKAEKCSVWLTHRVYCRSMAGSV